VGGSLAQIPLPQAEGPNTFNADNAMTAFGAQTLSYDMNGNLTADGTNRYKWDSRNHLRAIAGGVMAGFVYDAVGRRASKNMNGITTQFLYDRFNPVQELDAASPPNVTANTLTGLKIDEFFSRTEPACCGTRSYLTDALGSTVALTDGTSTIQDRYTYDPFGTIPLEIGTPGFTPSSNSYTFTGREADPDRLFLPRQVLQLDFPEIHLPRPDRLRWGRRESVRLRS